MDISYEIDLFGKNRASVKSASAALHGSRFDHDALSLVVMGDVASGYFTLLNLRERRVLSQENLDAAQKVEKIIYARFDAGAVTELDLAQQKVIVANSEAALAALEQQEKTVGHALAVLLGEPPGNINLATNSNKDIDVPSIAPGQPSDLLHRHPDIRSAEAALLAANANIVVAGGALFPSVTLGLGLNRAASGFDNPATTALDLASSLVAPIFQGGRLKGSVEKTKARQTELIENYHKIVLTAFREVEDAASSSKDCAKTASIAADCHGTIAEIL